MAVLAFVVVVGAFVLRWGFSLGSKVGDWAAAGEYFGGTLTPLLSFATLMALLVTLMMQWEQMLLAREQLRRAQGELERSHDMQLKMSIAMNVQARFATISARVAALSAAMSVVQHQMRQVSPNLQQSGEDPHYLGLQSQHADYVREVIDLTEELSASAAMAAQGPMPSA